MPRALTEKEKCAQCRRLLEKGKQAVMAYGMRKVNVDDITKAAGVAKGTFYQHFDSKENYLFALIEQIHHETFHEAKRILLDENTGKTLTKEKARAFLQELFTFPEMSFFIQNESEITRLMETSTGNDIQSFNQNEELLFTEIISLLGMDISKVKPGVVHNLVHSLFMVRSSELMVESDLTETLNLITDALISYLFKDRA